MDQKLANLKILLASIVELQELIDYAFFSGQHHLLPGLIALQKERLHHLDNTRSGN
jgi:hypothetical protein